jgi:hypothetical protein
LPNLDNLQKQAKHFLRRHRNRYYPPAAGIKAAWSQICVKQLLSTAFTVDTAPEIKELFRKFQAATVNFSLGFGAPYFIVGDPVVRFVRADLSR